MEIKNPQCFYPCTLWVFDLYTSGTFQKFFPQGDIRDKISLRPLQMESLAFTVSTGATSAREYLAVSALPGAADEPPRADALRGLT